MTEPRQCEFFLLRYVPDAVKDEFVNIGVVLLEPGAGGAEVRFTRDWSRVRCIDPAADVEMLEALEEDLRRELRAGGEARQAILKRLDESFSNVVQLSGTKACLAERPQEEVETLARLYLESSRRERAGRDASGRNRIRARMKTAFENAGVWEMMQKRIPVEAYTRKGDPLKIDCGYRPNGTVRLFHALALTGEADSAKVLAYSFPQIREGMARTLKIRAELTAVVDVVAGGDEQAEFAMETLRANSIEIAGVEQLAAIAERARQELKA